MPPRKKHYSIFNQFMIRYNCKEGEYMKNSLAEIVFGGLIIYLMPYLFNDVYVKNLGVAILVAVVLALLNKFVKPIISFFAFPLTVLTLGLFHLIINGFILMLATKILSPDFYINGFGTTIIVAFCISILYSLFSISKK